MPAPALPASSRCLRKGPPDMNQNVTRTRDLLVEIGCEDLPARYVVPLAEALAAGVTGGLARRGIETAGARTLATPRRIAVLIPAVAVEQPEQVIERAGPTLKVALKDGRPTPAGLGFARSCGVGFEALGERDGKLHYSTRQPGKATAELLPEIFEEALRGMDELVPKRMRWGAGEETFVRPVQWLTVLSGTDIVPLRRFGLDAGRLTYGHRFHAPEAITLEQAGDYQARLKAAHVWADVASRCAEIDRQIQAEGARLGGTAKIDAALLDEVTALVEWPVVISGRIEERFLELPPEVIVATVETNQRYFTVFDAAGKLLPAFITIANIESKDAAQIVAGNERVVRPRLSDALFFWRQDLKQPLAAYGEKLASVTFQKELGSTAAKVSRAVTLARSIAAAAGADREHCGRAAQLAKCDLVTKMVYEFPELQGLMGGYYAGKSGELAPVATAIREHYLPTQAGTPIPSTIEGRIVALADKLDTLAGIFAIGQKPTASKDPYALRRAALGVLRILVEGGLELDLHDLLQQALAAQPAGARDAATLDALVNFAMERLRAWRVGAEVYGRAIAVETFEAVLALGITQPLDFEHRLLALHGFQALPSAQSLAAAHKRVRNILRQAGEADIGVVDPARFMDDAESVLHRALLALPEGGDYVAQLTGLATLREPVDAFFEAVMVNDDDAAVRANRLALLAALDRRCRSVADISLLPG